jgi:DNA-binding response OmpR family regulator
VSQSDQPGRIVVVDDDPTVADVVGLYLVRDGHTVECVRDGHAALRRIAEFNPDLVVLDLMLPGIGGLEVCRLLRERWPIPVVMLTALGDETDRLAGFEIGADDYVTKPVRLRELTARIAANLRRARLDGHELQRSRLEFKDLLIDVNERRVVRQGDEIALTHTEFELLSLLAANAGKALSRERILQHIWGQGHQGDIETRVIDVHVRNLRRKIEPEPSHPFYVLAVPGIGYRFTNARSD